MRAILALAMKDLRLLLRDKGGFFFTFIFPVLYASLFGVIMSGFGDGRRDAALYVAVVDEDGTDGSRAFIQTLRDSADFNVFETDRARAVELVRRGEKVAYIALPPGFGAAREAMPFGAAPKLETGIDPGRQAEGAMLTGRLTGLLFEGMQEIFTQPEKMDAQVARTLAELDRADDVDPVTAAALRAFLPAIQGFMRAMPAGAMADGGFQAPSIEERSVVLERGGPRSSFEITFPQGVVWGIMGCAAGFGISLVVERTRGTLVRLCMSPIARWQILAGKGVACLLTTLSVSLLLFGVGWVVFGVRPDSLFKLALAVLSAALCFVGVMMLLSVLGKTEQSAGGIGWAILMVMAMIGGGMVPFAFLPTWLQQFASISPVKWSILAMEGAVWRGFTYGEMALPCGILLAIGAGCFVVGTRAFRWST